jgi:hypothetical protein
MLPPVIAVVEPGDEAGWLLTELRNRGVAIVDCRERAPRHLRYDEGMLIAPFCTEEALVRHLNRVHKEWRRLVAIVRPGKARVEQMLAG